MSHQPSEHPFFGEVISVYTRAQALADGVLIDAGPMACESGFRWPTAITAGAWADCVAWDDADSERQTHQDQSARLWDLLFMAAYAARADANAGSELLFEVFSQRYECGSILITSNLPFDEWTEVFGSERLTGALLDRLTHHVHILEMNGDSYRLKQSQTKKEAEPSQRHPLDPVSPQNPPTRAAAFAC